MEPHYVQPTFNVDPTLGFAGLRTEPMQIQVQSLATSCDDENLPRLMKASRRASDVGDNSSGFKKAWAQSGAGNSSKAASCRGPEIFADNEADPKEFHRGGKNFNFSNTNRWWTKLHPGFVCPVSNMSICVLPYPPFKLRSSAGPLANVKFVDGKYLAMMLVLDPTYAPCGCKMNKAEVDALDKYMKQSKLGRFRPSRAAYLLQKKNEAKKPEDVQHATQELNTFRDLAREHFGKLTVFQATRNTAALDENDTFVPTRISASSSIPMPAFDTPAKPPGLIAQDSNLYRQYPFAPDCRVMGGASCVLKNSLRAYPMTTSPSRFVERGGNWASEAADTEMWALLEQGFVTSL